MSLRRTLLVIFSMFLSYTWLADPVLAKKSEEKKSKEIEKVVDDTLAEALPTDATGDGTLAVPVEGGEGGAAQAEVNSAWVGNEPEIQVVKWGTQTRIIVSAAAATPPEMKEQILSVKFESLDGEFLGYRPFSPAEPRLAKFMIDPAKLPLKEARIIVENAEAGDWTKIISLENPADSEQPAVEAAAPVPAPVAQETPEEAKPKKKGWLW